MTDDLDALKASLRAGPAPNADAKAAALALAMKNFDALQNSAQGSADGLRPNPDRPKQAGLWNRMMKMRRGFSTTQALAGTASVAAICVAVVLVDKGPKVGLTPDPVVTELTEQVPEPAMTVAPEPKPAPDALVLEPAPAESRADDSAGQPASGRAEAEAVLQDQPLEAEVAEEPSADMELGGAVVVMEEPSPELTARIRPQAAPSPATTGVQLKEGHTFGIADGFGDGNGMAFSDLSVAVQTEVLPQPAPDTEAFANEAPNPVKMTAQEPVSTFSIDVDTASYAVVRNSLNMGMLPPAEAVRIEEMVNYFPYAYPAPAAGEAPFKPTVTVMPAPWNLGTQLVHIGIQGALPAMEDRPPLNLVFLIDTSGSMDEPNKLPLLQQSLSLMLGQLRPQDQVAIVAYAGSAGVVLEPTEAKDVARISAALSNLAAGGSTAGAEGLELAYQVAAGMAAEGEVSRVLLATDGDFNVGVSDPEGLEAYVAKKRATGIYLSVLGFGRGNLDDAIMQSLAQNGNGTAAYIDTLNEARKVLVDQLTGALFPIADDVKIQVEWNPAAVSEYRLIGYETRALRREDFNNDRVDAGEIGAGVTVTAIYEVVPAGSDAVLNDPLRYATQPATDAAIPAAEMGFLRLRYKAPGAATSDLIETPIANQPSATVSEDARFAVAIAGFGQLLTGATYLGDWGWDDAIAAALAARGSDEFGYRIEAVNLMRMAQSLSAN